MAQLRPFDILVIQTAIEDYRRKYPQRPVPSAEEALAWRFARHDKRPRRWGAAVARVYDRLRVWWKRGQQATPGSAALYQQDGIVR